MVPRGFMGRVSDHRTQCMLATPSLLSDMVATFPYSHIVNPLYTVTRLNKNLACTDMFFEHELIYAAK